MPVAWAVQSCGELPEQGYCWQPAADRGADPDLLVRGCAGRSVNDLIDDTKPSLLLYALRERGGRDPQWVLLLTGLRPATAGGDHMGRPVRASVLGTARAPAPPVDLLAVACRFLTGRLEDRLPLRHDLRASPQGFVVEPDKWAELVREARDDLAPAAPLPDPRNVRTDTDSEQNREEAVRMLAAFAAGTPERFARDARLVGYDARPLLVVTSLLSERSLQAVLPYCGLSRRVSRFQEIPWRKANGRKWWEKLTDASTAVLAAVVLTALIVVGLAVSLVLSL